MFEAARRLLIAEGDAIKRLVDVLDGNFQRALEILLNHNGKIIISGMGKSGHVAKKITATFRSIGQPAIFLHPSEGAHGDLGVYSPGDPTILISKSGTTDEIICLIPTLKKFQSKIISIVGDLDSPIAQASDVVIDISFAQEADPLGIVPTTSSMVSLAIGDAIAVELMSHRKISKQDFSQLHPAGQLGRNLLLRVQDVMSPLNMCAIVKGSASLREIVIAMTEYPLGGALVIDHDNILEGIITEGDIRRSLQNECSLQDILARDIMTRQPKCTREDAYVGDAVKIMEGAKRQIYVLPVVEEDATTGRNIALGLLRLHDTYTH